MIREFSLLGFDYSSILGGGAEVDWAMGLTSFQP